jgi:hypothetical protein
LRLAEGLSITLDVGPNEDPVPPISIAIAIAIVID